MADPIPEGFISLAEAWEAYAREWPGKPAPDDLVQPFADAELNAFVRLPPSEQHYRLTPASWREQFFSERVFLDDTIAHTTDDPWSHFSGRTPFVSEPDFRRWLVEHCRRERTALEKRFDPLAEAWWTLPMAVAWIRKPTPDAVREQWDTFRLAAGNESKASVALIDHDERPLHAAQELLSEAAAGSIHLTAHRVADDEIVTIPANEIPYLSLTFDGSPEYGERLERENDRGLGPVVYRNLRVLSSELENVWPRGIMRFSEMGEQPTLGQAIYWLGCQGADTPTDVIAADSLDEAGAKILFEKMKDGKPIARGLCIETGLREDIPSDVWEVTALHEPHDKKTFILSLFDERSDDPECGGALSHKAARSPRWADIRVKFADIQALLDHAPQQEGTKPTRPASEAALKKAFLAGVEFASDHGFSAPSRDEFTIMIREVYEGTSREKIRGIFEDPEISSHLPSRNGPRGPRNDNRDNEIEEIRQFLSTADLRN